MRVMRQRAFGGAGAQDCVASFAKDPTSGKERRMIGRGFSGSGGRKDQPSGQLRGHLFQVFKAPLICADVNSGCVIDGHRITNGFGALPAMSIHTLLVWRYSRMASMPLSRPIPERL